MGKVIRISIAAVLVVAAVGIYLAVSAYRDLAANLRAAEERSERLTRKLDMRTRDLGLSQSAAESAWKRAEASAREAEAKTMAAGAAEEEKRLAQEREALARGELAELHKRRQRELDRMQQALNKIAPTRRTASGMVIELANDSFYFDFDKAALRPENREILSRIAGVLLASEGYRLFVDGHTDDTGPDEYNQQLSLRRAQTVADYLKQAGVPADLMRVQGFGKANPRVRNSTNARRQKNRRVEIGIVDSIIDYKPLDSRG